MGEEEEKEYCVGGFVTACQGPQGLQFGCHKHSQRIKAVATLSWKLGAQSVGNMSFGIMQTATYYISS